MTTQSFKRRKIAHSSNEDTAILDLNDDCLLEVFKHFDLQDLCEVADVCARFRQNAKTSFRFSRKNGLSLAEDIKSDGDSMEQFVLKTSKILRNFGASFITFYENGTCGRRQNDWSEKSRAICRQQMCELLARYCINIRDLKFSGIDIKEEMVPTWKPLQKRLNKLILKSCKIGNAFLEMLPLCSPELQELKLSLRPQWNGIFERKLLRFDGLYQPFTKLIKISLIDIANLENNDIEEILKHNPQVKEIAIRRCSKLNHQIFRSIANHTPSIACLEFNPVLLT